jgi:phosphomannomutase
MLDRICKKYGRELIEHGIGFKYVCDLMLEREIVMGGEESGGIGFQRHLPERDGLLNCLLLANVMAEEGKTLGQLVADLQAEYGEHQYGRIDLHIPTTSRTPPSPAPRAQARRPGLRRHAHLRQEISTA